MPDHHRNFRLLVLWSSNLDPRTGFSRVLTGSNAGPIIENTKIIDLFP